jgi:hypothetical protein
MMVVKKQKGFVIRLSDSEYDALRLMTLIGQEAARDKKQHGPLSNQARGAIRKERFTKDGGPLSVIDVDRRNTDDAGATEEIAAAAE